MSEPLTYRDISLLGQNNFEAASLWSWFGRDIDGQLWQATECDDNQYLQFRKVMDNHTTAWEIMTRKEFEEQFR